MPSTIPPPAADSHPRCPVCGARATDRGAHRIERPGIQVVSYLCSSRDPHLFEIRWAASA